MPHPEAAMRRRVPKSDLAEEAGGAPEALRHDQLIFRITNYATFGMTTESYKCYYI